MIKNHITKFLLKDLNQEDFYLNHEGSEDLDLIKQINTLDLPIFTDLNAEQIKNIIGQSKLLISSRFH